MTKTTKDLIEHRTKLVGMKADMVCRLHGETTYSGWLDHDIKECDRLIELAIKQGASNAEI